MTSDIGKLSGKRKVASRYPFHNSPRRSNLRLVSTGLVAFFLAGIFLFSRDLPTISFLPSGGGSSPVDTKRIAKIRQLQDDLLDRWPESGYANYRPFTISALDRLASCLETNTCGKGEMTVILLGSFHFGNSQSGHTSGEDIWAASLVEILQLHNYTLLYTYEALETLLVYKTLGDITPLVIMEAGATDQCVKIGKMTREEAAVMKPKIEGLQYIPNQEVLGCAKRAGYEDGIPMQKVRSLHFWHGLRHPLTGFTLSPENYTGWWADTGNYYLGYHLAHCRNVRSAQQHKRRAFILGKRPAYFADDKYAWPKGLLAELKEEIGDGFEFVGGAGRAGVDEMPEPGITNLGSMDKETWNNEVAQSAVMLGIGNPPLSPSPYDSWCLGVPFINPIIRWDTKKTHDRHMWLTQHEALKVFDPPYVYHVFHDDREALKNAILSAIDNPFPPYIPERMKRDSVEARLMHLINHNWTMEAEILIQEGKGDGFVDEVKGHNLMDGLLL